MKPFPNKELLVMVGLISWTLFILGPAHPQEITQLRELGRGGRDIIIMRPRELDRFDMQPDRDGRDTTLQFPKELGRDGRDTILESLLSIDPKSTVVVLNKNANTIQFQYFDQGAQSWKRESLNRRSMKVLSCAACQSVIKIYFHDAVQDQEHELKLGTFGLFDKTADGNRWQLVRAE